MAEWIKIALKAGLVVVICTALWSVLLNVQFIPTITFSQEMKQGFGLAKRVVDFYYPGFNNFLIFAFAVCALRLGLMGMKVTMILVKWLYQIFE